MPVYVWKGKAPGGLTQTGELTFATKDEVMQYLRRKRIIANDIREKGSARRFALPKKGVGIRDLVLFTRQFSTMVNAGLPLVQCLDILSKQAESANFRQVVADVMHDVEAGSTLAEAMGKRADAFDNLYVNMVDAGEAGGILDDILARLAGYLEKAEALRRKVKSALTYPTVVLIVALGATTFMLLFIIPTFAKVFSDFGGELPMATRIVLNLSNFVKMFWWAIILVIVGSVFTVKRLYKTEAGRLRIDAALLRAPIFGNILRKASIARFTRTLGTMISSGVPILSALDITARTAGNRIIENAILLTKGSIGEGETIAAPLKESKVFPPMVVQMIAVGEETGALDKMLDKIANFYDEEVNVAVDTLTSIIEPVMIVVMGTLVGGMVVAMYMPMFKLVNVIAPGH
ncbi:MAG: type II secretion system F family protein [Candidatus Eisenbacteria bacterium]|uniref:Type II secretion system F family protein n=1 Tax=Eiseniibacteriota bacterium TaxID=2212470 RepID=A0A956RQD5_UNCEI|nr:type II secretion system F family protein [Candidatus Eisenbacteria bacterium]